MAELTTYGMQEVLTFPFKDPKWKSKLVVGMLLTLAGVFVPVIPFLFITGYAYQILHRLIVDRGDLYLPEWDDWGKYIKDGFRLFAVSFVYMLPALLAALIGVIAYFGMFVAMIAAEESGNDPASVLPMFIAMGALFLSMALSMLFTLAAAVFLPPATAHAVACDSFAAAFDFNGWWKVFRANIGGFFLAIILVMGLMGFVYFLSYIFYMTIVLMCLMFILPAVLSFYILLTGCPLIALAYREGVDRLAGKRAALTPVEPVESKPDTPSKPRARRTRVRE